MITRDSIAEDGAARDAHGETARSEPEKPMLEEMSRASTPGNATNVYKDQGGGSGAETPVINEILQKEIAERRRLEMELRDKNRILKAVFGSVQDGISVLDADLTIVSVNRTIRDWYSHMSPLGNKKCYEAYRGRSEPCPACPALRALKTGKVEKEEVPLVGAGGEAGALELFAYPMLDESGKASGVVEYVRDITARKEMTGNLKFQDRSLEDRSLQDQNLEEIKAGFRAIIKFREADKRSLEEKVLSNVRMLIMPYIEKLEKSRLDDMQMEYLNIVGSHLKDITAPFISRLSLKHSDLTPTEIRVAELIKEGRTTKEIAKLFHSSKSAVEFHRNNLRRKLGLLNTKKNLRTHLMTMR